MDTAPGNIDASLAEGQVVTTGFLEEEGARAGTR